MMHTEDVLLSTALGKSEAHFADWPWARRYRVLLRTTIVWGCIGLGICGIPQHAVGQPEANRAALSFRPVKDEAEMRRWLTNMVGYHHFTLEEVSAATGMSLDQVRAALDRLQIKPGDIPPRPADSPLVVLPYPGGRHPRIGFLDGAVDPQRETKASVFTPWDPASYVVVDLPEAIWSDLGLTYLAHTHIPTIWDSQQIRLEPLEWEPIDGGRLRLRRRLPNGLEFGTLIVPRADHVRMQMWIHNGTGQLRHQLRAQICVMLKGATGFTQQTNDNKIIRPPYVACRSETGDRWIITGWKPLHRAWANPPCPCLHADPRFDDCPPGSTVRATGWLSFYEGTDIDGELERIERTGWAETPLPGESQDRE